MEVFTSKERITGRREVLEETISEGKKGSIEGSSSEIVDNDTCFAILIETISNSDGSLTMRST